MARPIPPDLLRQALETWEAHGYNEVHAARALRIPRSTLQGRLREILAREGSTPHEWRKRYAKDAHKAFRAAPVADPDEPIEDLIARKKALLRRRQAHEAGTKLRQVTVNIDGPFGILHFGDPHLDDDHCDIGAIEEHCRIVRETEGMYAGNVGDVTNNWVGRMAYLHSSQSTTRSDAWRLVEWMMRSLDDRLLYLVGGNHDAWSGDSDPLQWIMRQHSAVSQSSEVRLAIKHSTGTLRLNARHDFAGHSQYNAAHGVAKALQFGVRDHLAVCGHKHVSAYNVLRDTDSGIVMHALRVASYKLIDHYAKTKGFRDQHLSPCAVTLIDTTLPETHPDHVKVYWDAHAGATALAEMRARWRAGKSRKKAA